MKEKENTQMTESQLDKIRLEHEFKVLVIDQKRLDQDIKEFDQQNDYQKQDCDTNIRKMQCEIARRNVEQILQLFSEVGRNNTPAMIDVVLNNNKDVINDILETNLPELVNTKNKQK